MNNKRLFCWQFSGSSKYYTILYFRYQDIFATTGIHCFYIHSGRFFIRTVLVKTELLTIVPASN